MGAAPGTSTPNAFDYLGDVGGALFGTSGQPGVFGTGTYKPTAATPATQYYNQGQGALNLQENRAQDLGTSALARTAPGMAGSQAGPAANALASQINPHVADVGPAAQAARTVLGSPTLVGRNQVNTGNASLAGNAAAAGTQLNVQGPGTGAETSSLDLLNQAAHGGGPSAAQSTLTAATDANIKQQMALAASLGGRNPAEAARQAMANGANAQQVAANQAATLRAQEQQQGEAQFAGASTSARAQDIGAATTNAQLGQGNQQFNAANVQAANEANAARLQQASQFGAEAQNLALGENARAANASTLQQGTFDYGTGQFNAEQTNANNRLGAQLATGVGTSNAQLGTGVSEANAAAANAVNAQNATLGETTGIQNLGANLQTTAEGDKAAIAAMGLQGNLTGQSIGAEQAANDLAVQQALGLSGISQKAYEGGRSGGQSFMGSLSKAIPLLGSLF
jgi:hypothetical protein